MNMSILYNMKKRNPKKIYQMILISLILTVFITVLILSVTLYTSFERKSMENTQSLITKNMEKIMQGTEFMTSTGKNLSIQIFNDLNVSKLLYNNSNNYTDINVALQQLGFYRQTTPFIDSIYVYNVKEKKIYISSSNAENSIQNEDDFYDNGIISIIKSTRTYKLLSPIPRSFKNRIRSNGNMISNVYTFIYFGAPVWEQQPDYAVVVNISADWVVELTDGLNENSNSNTFLIDKDGRAVSYSYQYPIMSDISNEDFVKKIINSQQENGYLKEKIGKTEMLISYFSSKDNGWSLVQLTPYSTIMKGFKDLRNNTILTAFFILVIGFLIMYLLSRKIYAPIEGILLKLKKLEAEKVDSSYNLKQEFLRNLLMESKRHSSETMQMKLADFHISFDTESQLILILLIIDKYSDFCDKYNLEDRSTFKFAIMKIANELLAKINPNVESVDMGDDKIALILNLEDDEAECTVELIDECIRNISSNVLAYLKISITAVVSSARKNLYNLNVVYNNLLEYSLQRTVYGYGSIIHAETVNTFKDKTYKYSYEKEKLLLNNIMLDNMSEAKKIYIEIINEIKGCSYITIQFVLSRLIFSINLAVETIKKNSFIESDLDININHLFFSNTETLDEIGERIFNIFDKISANIEGKRNSSYDHITNKIIKIVNSEYINPSLSISYIADKMDLSQTYVGRLFKKHTLKSIVEYIMETRLKKANELLMNTNCSIEEIANRTGFSSSIYFHASYKKAYGVTPGEHRLKAKIQMKNESNHG